MHHRLIMIALLGAVMVADAVTTTVKPLLPWCDQYRGLLMACKKHKAS